MSPQDTGRQLWGNPGIVSLRQFWDNDAWIQLGQESLLMNKKGLRTYLFVEEEDEWGGGGKEGSLWALNLRTYLFVEEEDEWGGGGKEGSLEHLPQELTCEEEDEWGGGKEGSLEHLPQELTCEEEDEWGGGKEGSLDWAFTRTLTHPYS
jgi:hypothetical protein